MSGTEVDEVHPRARRDGGFSLIELLVSVALIGLLGAIGNSLLHRVNQGSDEQVQRTHVATQIDDANGQLQRDVSDGQSLRLADANHLTLTVIRDGKCNIRDYVADPVTAKTLTVVTTFYETKACSGASADRTVILMDRYIQAVTFTFWGESASIPIPTPAQDLRNVKRIAWTLGASPYVNRVAPPVTLNSAQVFRGLGEATGTGVAQLQAQRPVLTIITAVPGKDTPIIGWTDPTPTLTAGWVVTRGTGPEGAVDGSYQVVARLAGTQLTWADTTLPDGARATYVVYAILTDSTQGPASNNTDTGRRPATPTGVTATGTPTSIIVNWNAMSGATAYDVYRDGVLAAGVGAVLSWTDVLSYGHSHTYQVVATNRWAQKLETGTETGRVPLGDDVTKVYSGGTRLASAVTAASGAFTAPAAPTLAATPNADWSNTVTVAYAAWTGSGPTTKAGVSRDRGWVTQSATLAGAFGALWGESAAASQVQAGVTHGATTRYQAQGCNASGCGPYGAVVSALQRPATPASCTPSAQSTRGMNVTVDPGTQEAAVTMYRLSGGSGAPTGTGDQSGSATFTIDQLTHATTHTWTVQTQNASPANGGWSDATTCQGTTATLGVAITGVSSSTRTVNATMSTANGSSSSLTLEGVRTDANVTSASWDPLSDGTGFTVTARNSDGYNDVVAQTAVSTAVLATPGVPTCASTLIDSVDPGSIKISGGDQVKLGSGGLTYANGTTFSGLGVGTYYGYARNTASDGYPPNDKVSGWDTCPGRTIDVPIPAAPTSLGGGSRGWQYCDSGSPKTVFYTQSGTVSYATGYHAEFYRENTVNLGTDQGPLAHDTQWNFFGSIPDGSNWVKVRFNASNASGTSGWGPWISLPVTTGLC